MTQVRAIAGSCTVPDQERRSNPEERRSEVRSPLWRNTGFAVFFGLIICLSPGAAGSSADTITVIDNHLPGKSKDELSTKGGLSAFVEYNGGVILFDTGGESGSLVENIRNLGLDAARIDAIVVSHNHWDQVHGLPGVLSATGMKAKVYVPAPAGESIFLQNPQADVIAVVKPIGILPQVWLVGPIELEYRGGTIAEQVLVLESTDGLVVIVGCSHPGIVSVVERVREVFGHRRIKLVAGGFHLRGTSKDEIKEISLRLQQLGVKTLGLSHCTGDAALKIFRREWGDRVVAFDQGDSVGF